MMHGSLNMECDRYNCLSFWGIFCSFTTLTTQKIKILKKWKKTTLRYHHFTQVYHKWQSYDVWFLRYELQQTKYFVILDHFLPFYHLNNEENQNFEKMKKPSGDIIILNKCTINDNHMMYGSWDMKHDTKCFVILGHFVLFHPTNNLKNQNI